GGRAERFCGNGRNRSAPIHPAVERSRTRTSCNSPRAEPAESDSYRRRQRPAQCRVCRVGDAWPKWDPDHRPGEGIRRNLHAETIRTDPLIARQQRKAALLKKFGSVQRLRRATIEEIAAVPGFGGKAAGELKAFLEARSPL